jgi:hypothetical protein
VSSMVQSLFGRLVTLAGGRPEVVLPLYRGIELAAAGRNDLLRQRSRRQFFLSAEALRLIFMVLTALGSVVLSFAMVLNPPDHHPDVGVLVLVAAHWLLTAGMVVSLAGPSLLVDDDQQVLGWWPVSRRELLLARLGTLLKPALQVTLALGLVPLVVFAFTGRPPVLMAALLGVGLLIQTLGVAFGTAAVLALVVRLWGRRRAERLAALAADSNIFMYFWLLGAFMPRLEPFFTAHAGLFLALPLFWFTIFGDPLAGPLAQAAGAVGVVWCLTSVAVGLRLLGRAHAGEMAEPLATRPPRWHHASVVSWLLRPMMPGREGWVVRRLLESHLRDDWRFIGGMLTLPVMIAVMFFVASDAAPAGTGSPELAHTALQAVENSPFVMVLAATVIFLTTFSSTPAALWPVALADLDTGRLLTAQRGMIRGLVVAPVLVLYAVKAALLGASPGIIILDLVVLALQVETVLTILQPMIMIMPFSQPYTSDHSSRRVVLGLLGLGLAVVFVVLNYLYARYEPARWSCWIGLPVLLLLSRAWLRHRIAGRRLQMGVVHDG